MKTAALTTAIALTLSAPAFAAGMTASGADVQSGAYTTAEMIQLDQAVEAGDTQRVLFILNGGANPVGADAGAELAASLGVDAADYSLSDLVALRAAMEDGDQPMINFLMSGGSEVVSTQGRSDSYQTARAILADGDLD